MNILVKFIESLSSAMHDYCTCAIVIIVLFLFLYFGTSVARIAWLSRRMGKYPKDNLLEALKNDKAVHFIAKEYEDSICYESEDGKKKTPDFASSYFNPKSVLNAAKINSHAMGAAAGILVGIGVLGTFIGLTIGIGGIDISDSERLSAGIQNLLGGMNTAFWTSIFGMFFSTAFILFEKYALHKTSRVCSKISDWLDSDYHISDLRRREEIFREQRKNWKGLLNALESQDKNGNILTVGNLLREIHTEAANQTEHLGSLAEDVCNQIADVFNQKTMPQLIEKLDSLEKALKNPAASMANNIGANLSETLSSIVSELKSTISQATTEKLDTLSTHLEKTTSTLTQLPTTMNSMTEIVQTNILALGKMMETLQSRTNDSQKNSLKMQSQLNGQFEEMMGNVQKSLQESLKNTAELVQKINDTLPGFENIQRGLSESTSALEKVSTSMESSSSTMCQVQETLVKTIDSSMAKTGEAFENIQSSLQKSSEINEQFGKDCEQIRESLDGVFKNMNEALQQYAKTVKENTNEYLESYSKNVKDISVRLTNAYSELSDTVDSLESALKTGRGEA